MSILPYCLYVSRNLCIRLKLTTSGSFFSSGGGSSPCDATSALSPSTGDAAVVPSVCVTVVFWVPPSLLVFWRTTTSFTLSRETLNRSSLFGSVLKSDVEMHSPGIMLCFEKRLEWQDVEVNCGRRQRESVVSHWCGVVKWLDDVIEPRNDLWYGRMCPCCPVKPEIYKEMSLFENVVYYFLA